MSKLSPIILVFLLFPKFKCNYRAADKDSSLTGHFTVIIFGPGFIVHVCPDK